MSFQELCEKYKKEICPNCLNKTSELCNICKTNDGIRCCEYIRKKERKKERKKWKSIENWQRW